MGDKPTYEALEQRIKDLEKDVLEIKQRENKLVEQEETLKALMDTATESAILIDPEGIILAINETAAKRYGMLPDALIGKRLHDFIHPDVAESRLINEEEVIRTRKPVHFQDQREGRFFDINLSPLLGPDGNVTAISIYARDITEFRQVEEALKNEAVWRRLLVEQSRDGIVILDQNGKTYEANQRFADMLGYPRDEISQLYIWDWDAVFTREELMGMAQTVDETGDHFETRHRRKDGTIYDVEISTNGAIFGGQKLIFCVCRDITARKQAETALKEANDIINKGPAIAFLWKNAGELPVEFVSENVERLFDYSTEDFTSGKINYLDTVHHDDRLGLEQEFNKYRLMQDQDKYAHKPYRIITKSGRMKWVDHITFKQKDEDANITHLQGIVLDITDRVEAEEERKRIQAQLQQAQKMEAIGTLAGGVAHDLNNIMSGIVGYPELILMDLPEDSPLRNPILNIKNSGERAAVIVQDLLTLARRGVSVAEVVNLNHIIADQMVSPEYNDLMFSHPDVEVVTAFENDLLNVKGSSTHLAKAVMNLIANAVESMPDGGKIRISTENRYIDRPIKGFDHVDEGDYALVKVSDTGVGIPEEDIDKIFEPFYTKKVMGRSGTGLGMTVVLGAVKDHRGFIDIQSDKKKGTTFTLYFPVTREDLLAERSPLSLNDYMGNGESILLVDDVKEQRELASLMLTKLGYSVHTVSSGEEAVTYLREKHADIMILDMIMDPGIDGLETYKRIKEFRPNQNTLIVSGFSETTQVREIQRLGGGKYIQKPYTLERIGLALKEELH